jgi:FixJ family two-component response regulator
MFRQVGQRVVFLDDDDDLRQAFAEMVDVFTTSECLCMGSFDELVRHRDRVLDAKLAILDVNLGSGVPSGLDAYRWLRRQGFTGAIVFLTGHAASQPLVVEARRLGDARVFEKPLAVPAIIELLEQGAGSCDGGSPR